MSFPGIEEIRQVGFSGFLPVSTLQKSDCAQVPEVHGVYFVLKLDAARPIFLERSIGGHFRGKDPTVSPVILSAKWVPDARVLYIGKAGPGKATLQSRLRQYMQFGQGKPIGHWGGRYIWQLCNPRDLVVCWKAASDPRRVEQEWVGNFEEEFRKLPFANLQH